jgi:putative methyltransferase (TIGR04325 family)
MNPVRILRDCKQHLLFGRQTQQNIFRGVFESFPQATAAVPKTGKKTGYDHPETVHMYDHFVEGIFSYDYPILFWLQSLLPECSSVFDLGGNTGIKYYAYKKYLTYPSNLKWTVCDVPTVTQGGEVMATKRESQGLTFTNAPRDADGVDILLAAGAVQYIETSFGQSLVSLNRKPKHLLINKVPLYAGKSFVTLQSIGTVICPYHIFNRDDFIGSITRHGYELIDTWETQETTCSIPFHPEKSIRACKGLYFRQKR